MLVKCSRFWLDEESIRLRDNLRDDPRNDYLFVIASVSEAISQIAGLPRHPDEQDGSQ